MGSIFSVERPGSLACRGVHRLKCDNRCTQKRNPFIAKSSAAVLCESGYRMSIPWPGVAVHLGGSANVHNSIFVALYNIPDNLLRVQTQISLRAVHSVYLLRIFSLLFFSFSITARSSLRYDGELKKRILQRFRWRTTAARFSGKCAAVTILVSA